MTGATPSAPPVPPETPQGTLLLLVRHGETPTTGMVLPVRAPGLYLSDRGRAHRPRGPAAVPVCPAHSLGLPLPGGESFTQMQVRMVGTLEALAAAHAGGVVVCFSHADPIKAAVGHAVGTHLDLFQRIVISPGSVSAIAAGHGQVPAVLMVNSTLEPLNTLRAP